MSLLVRDTWCVCCGIRTLRMQPAYCHAYTFRYNDMVPESPGARILPRGASGTPRNVAVISTRACRTTETLPLHAGNQTLVVLIGNSKNLWPAFIAACRQDTGMLTDADPLDTYIEQGVKCAVQTVSG